MAYSREGSSAFAFLANNPGGFVTANRNLSLNNLGTLPLLLRETGRLGPPSFESGPVYPLSGAVTNSANAIDPNLKMPRVQSWSFGIADQLLSRSGRRRRVFSSAASRRNLRISA